MRRILLTLFLPFLLLACEPHPRTFLPEVPLPERHATTVTLELDFSNPNNTNGRVGYRYYYAGGDYPADYASYRAWSCSPTQPEFFGAWNDTEGTIWLGTCPPIDPRSLRIIAGGTSTPPASVDPLPRSHEPSFRITPAPSVRATIFNDGVTRLSLTFDLI